MREQSIKDWHCYVTWSVLLALDFAALGLVVYGVSYLWWLTGRF